MLKKIPFSMAFRSLTDNEPFPWQEELYRLLSTGDVPAACDVPTGLGKTAVIPIWLIALANQCPGIPRRLIYVVNRRTVVDQATSEAVRLRERLNQSDTSHAPQDELEQARNQLSRALRALNAGTASEPLAISTLRGQFADNREWSADPSRAAIIVGTVDMIGSRLLFGGYGLGFKTRPLHAGFLGQDALLVHDEAHLEAPFQQLIEAIRQEQKNEPAPLGVGLGLRIMALSATPRNSAAVELSDRDRAHPRVKQRINAQKTIHLHEYDDEKKLAERLAEQALRRKESGRTVLIFARSVEVVEKVAERLRNENSVTLTGTMRGKERDALLANPTFRRFLHEPDAGGRNGNGPAFLACTSAGEIGINISAHDIVCDLSTFESMAQRFGRVNRFGVQSDARVDVFHPKTFGEKSDYDARRKRTLDLLRSLNGDGSPAALSRLDPDARQAAFEPTPEILPTSEILFDAWSLTSLRERLPGRPPLEPYLHGVSEQEPPMTYVAWRDEVEIVVGSLRDRNPPVELLADYPLKPHELLRDHSDRVFKHIATLAVKHPDEPTWLLDDEGGIEFPTLKELADRDRKARIQGRTILLPSSVGGLQNGLLNGSAGTAEDVAEDWGETDGAKRRIRTWDNEPVPSGMRLIRTIDVKPEATDENESDAQTETTSRRYWRWYTRPRFADDDGSKTSSISITLNHHINDVMDHASRIVRNLPLPEAIKTTIVLAAKFHDIGKRRIVWQRSIGNPTPQRWLAKSGPGMKPIELNPYRHEFGSLLDVQNEPEFKALNADQKELVEHLIAAHHGFGRPHFPAELAFDLEPPEGVTSAALAATAAAVPQRFARLQKLYGRWGLAYLESLLRAADYAASAAPSQPEDSNP